MHCLRAFWIGLTVAIASSPMALWGQGADLNFVQKDGAIHGALMAPHSNQHAIPPGFDVELNIREEAGALWLVSDVRLPYGGYVISATCDVDYLGKFQLNWLDSTQVQTEAWSEFPPSELGFEPFDSRMVPMLLKNTKVAARVTVAEGLDAVAGEVFFVLEPQCVPYRLPFQLTLAESGWSVIQGRLASALQD